MTFTNLYGYIVLMSNSFPFTPVPRKRSRADGWSAARQREFIAALADCGIVSAAAERVGMNRISAYRLRDADGAEEFAEAWDKAQNCGFARLQDIAMDRAVNGVAVPHYYKGEKVGETRWYDNRLLTFLLRQTQSRRFGPFAADMDFTEHLAETEKAKARQNAAAIQKLRGAMDSYDKMIQQEYDLPAEERSPELNDWIHKRDTLDNEIIRRGG
ncbi:hypothetical protein ACFOWX_11570 [Sphingorhabdus arenilitoris]|uniref:Helix-turn-helix domain-containing protein n=1 Tax=Sphingorhabdus arenilitoris TaxID=1490041 RepID=A0ABV8RI12_9SPHN